jgi:transposase-like protein
LVCGNIDSGEILAIYTLPSRNMLIAMKFLRIVLDRCVNKPLIVIDKGPWYRWTLERLSSIKHRYQKLGLRNKCVEGLQISKTKDKKSIMT